MKIILDDEILDTSIFWIDILALKVIKYLGPVAKYDSRKLYIDEGLVLNLADCSLRTPAGNVTFIENISEIRFVKDKDIEVFVHSIDKNDNTILSSFYCKIKE